jgi:prophage regulatory protein
MKTLRVKQVAEKLGISIPSVWRLNCSEAFPKPFKLLSNITVWDETELDSYLLSRKQEYRNETVGNEGLSAR